MNEIAELLDLKQPQASKHLRVLREVGLVSVREAGQQRLYRLQGEGLKPIHDWVKPFEQLWNERFDRLAVCLDEVDTDPVDQLNWGLQALSVMESLSQPAAWQWEGSLRNNVGYALYEQSRYEEPLAQVERALTLRERAGNPEQTRVATWMAAWTLRALGRLDEALDLQLRLEREGTATDAPDP